MGFLWKLKGPSSLSSMWLVPPGIFTLGGLPHVYLPGGSCFSPVPVHPATLQELLEEISWGTKVNGESQPVPRVTGGRRAAWYCCFHPPRPGAVQKWDMVCPKVTWQMSPKSGLDPTAFIPSPRYLRPPLHIALGSHGPLGRRAGSFSLSPFGKSLLRCLYSGGSDEPSDLAGVPTACMMDVRGGL